MFLGASSRLWARRLCTTNVNAWYDVVIVGGGMVGGALSCALGESEKLKRYACALITADIL